MQTATTSPPSTQAQRPGYPSDLGDAEWARLRPLLDIQTLDRGAHLRLVELLAALEQGLRVLAPFQRKHDLRHFHSDHASPYR